MPKTARINLRVSDDVKEILEQHAAADHRSLTSMVEKIIATWIEANAKPAKGKK